MNNSRTSTNNIVYVTSLEELECLVRESNQLVIICYSDWCPACLISKMYFEQLADIYHSKCTFIKVIVDEVPIFNFPLKIRSIPTFFFFKDKNLKNRIDGSISYSLLENYICNFFQIKKF